MNIESMKLVDAPTLLEVLFDEAARPSVRWLRSQQKAKTIPHVRVGRLVFFSPPAVQAALEKRTIKGRA